MASRERCSGPLPPPLLDPAPAGTHAVQVLRTYPVRFPRYPFAPDGERSVARAFRKAVARARRLIYIEDQYFWSTEMAGVLAEALRREPKLQLVVVVPRYPDKDGRASGPPSRLAQSRAIDIVQQAGGDRVGVFDLENEDGTPIYVHAKTCVIDDVWASVGSDNLNRRSWTHDSELSCAVLDESHDDRAPLDPAGLGDGARRFARDLRMTLWSEHLGADVVDIEGSVARWRDAGGRVRPHENAPVDGAAPRALAELIYRVIYDPDGRTWRARRKGSF
jgi:phosphatidylserine/phosphatidylglycerophosphate/cardiolipin synthase-like enzyme